MAFQLEPITIAAIGSAGFAVSLILLLLIRKLLNHRSDDSNYDSSSSRASSPGHSRSRSAADSSDGRGGGARTSYTTFGYTQTQTPSSARYHDHSQPQPQPQYGYSPHSNTHSHGHVAPSPSTGHTTLVTPSTGGSKSSKLKKGLSLKSPGSGGRERGELKEMGGGGSGGGGKGKKNKDELVVVTYEDGLRKLGIDPLDPKSPWISSRPHHQHQHHQQPASAAARNQRSDPRQGQGRYSYGDQRYTPRIITSPGTLNARSNANANPNEAPLDTFSGFSTGSGVDDPRTQILNMINSERERYQQGGDGGSKPSRNPSLERDLPRVPGESGIGRGTETGGRMRAGTTGTLGPSGTIKTVRTVGSGWLPSYYQMSQIEREGGR
ncbi:hypothetical protein I317_05896 [Kwoniella heveanensis CBS 569]|nr:hypothetical protein I317_05896 [Kwoniella heveanensis CBS 569]